MVRKLALTLIAAAALGGAAFLSSAASAAGPGWCYWHPYACEAD